MEQDMYKHIKTTMVVAATSLLLTGCAGKKPNSNLDSARATYERVSDNPVVSKHSTEDLNVAKRKLDSAIAAWKGKKSKSEIDRRAYIAEQYALIAEQRSTLLQHQSAIADGKLTRTNVQMELRASEAEAARSEAQALAAQSAALEQEVMEREKRLQEQLAEIEELKALQATSSDRGMVLTLGDVLFDINESTLKPAAQQNLQQVAAFLNKYPDRTLVIEGHTDNTGDEQYNMNLSSERAVTVKAALTAQGINGSRITARGLGESSPLASNANSAGRQRNRRVDLIFTEPDNVTISSIDQ
jgi:outer membrane protein OmpA-like peptidoglycan-associated protein